MVKVMFPNTKPLIYEKANRVREGNNCFFIYAEDSGWPIAYISHASKCVIEIHNESDGEVRK